MPFDDVTIPGVAGPVSTTSSFWKGYRFHVDGTRVKPHGFPPTKLDLPGTDGPVEARLKGGIFRAHPVLVVDGQEYRTGPPTPRAQQVLAVLPFLLLLLVQGVLGAFAAIGGVVANMAIVRSGLTDRSKIAAMIGVFAVALLVDVAVIVAVVSAS